MEHLVVAFTSKVQNEASHRERVIVKTWESRREPAIILDRKHKVVDSRIYSNLHPILGLNDTIFRASNIDALMDNYGPIHNSCVLISFITPSIYRPGTALGDGSCEDDFGNGLIRRWRKQRAPYCSARPQSSSSIDCFLVRQTRHHGNGDQLCHAKDVALDMSVFSDKSATGPRAAALVK